jgi:hypothetical protein
MTRRTLYVCCLGMALIGCSSTGIVMTDAGQYMIAMKRQQFGFGPPHVIHAQVYREANEFCGKENKAVETIKLEVNNAGFARLGAVTLEFRCKSTT